MSDIPSMVHAFETTHLSVWKAALANKPSRILFVGLPQFVLDDRPMVAATLLAADYGFGTWYVDWIEVSSAHRRKGIGTELFKGVEEHLGCRLAADPGSDEGEAFLDSR